MFTQKAVASKKIILRLSFISGGFGMIEVANDQYDILVKDIVNSINNKTVINILFTTFYAFSSTSNPFASSLNKYVLINGASIVGIETV